MNFLSNLTDIFMQCFQLNTGFKQLTDIPWSIVSCAWSWFWSRIYSDTIRLWLALARTNRCRAKVLWWHHLSYSQRRRHTWNTMASLHVDAVDWPMRITMFVQSIPTRSELSFDRQWASKKEGLLLIQPKWWSYNQSRRCHLRLECLKKCWCFPCLHWN